MKVVFKEEDHSYTNTTSGEQYISVTTLIKKYTPPFDEDYWSSFKALKAVLTKYGKYREYCAMASGWDYLVEYCRAQAAARTFPYRDEVVQEKARLLAEWADKRKRSSDEGTAFHKRKEEETLGKTATFNDPALGVVPVFTRTDLLDNPDENNCIYTELLIFDHDFRIAGQADKVLKEGRNIHITDYKTSEKIKRDSFRGQSLLHPLTAIPNANFFTYGLQLSLYGYMAERKGYRVGDLIIDHVKGDERFAVPYMKDEVEMMVSHYLASEGKKKR